MPLMPKHTKTENSKSMYYYFPQSFLSVWAIMRAGNISTRSILTPILFILCSIFFKHVSLKKNSRRINYTAVIISVVFTLLYLLADTASLTADLSSRLFQVIILLACAMGLFLLFYYTLLLIFFYTSHYTLKEELAPMKYLPYAGFFFCLVFWLPYFLYEFPGIMTPDSINQYEQVIGMVPYSNHHPWAHTMVIGLFYRIGGLFTSDAVTALGFFTLFQMLFMAATVAWLMATLQQFRIKNSIIILIASFYALVPYHAVLSVTIWKDVLFSGAVLLFTTALLRILFLFPILQRRKKTATLIMYIISCMMMCLFRSNGWYAFLFSLPFLLYVFYRKRKLMIPINISLLIIVLIIKGPVMTSWNVTQPDFVESISIPLQQVARVLCEDKTLTEEEWTSIHNVIDTTYIKELYAPNFADNMKELVRAGHPEYLTEHKDEYLKLWLSLGIRYPGTYIQAHIDQTIGYWYPDVAYTVADIDGVIINDTGITSRPFIGGPFVVKAKEILLKLGDILPLYGLLFSMGFMLWATLCFIGIITIKKQYQKYILFLPGVAVILTLFIATPVSSEFRYAYSLAYTLPLYLLIPFLQESHPKL